VHTKEDGSFKIPVPPGLYDLSIKAPGFKTKNLRDVNLQTSDESMTPLHLELAPISSKTEPTPSPSPGPEPIPKNHKEAHDESPDASPQNNTEAYDERTRKSILGRNVIRPISDEISGWIKDNVKEIMELCEIGAISPSEAKERLRALADRAERAHGRAGRQLVSEYMYLAGTPVGRAAIASGRFAQRKAAEAKPHVKNVAANIGLGWLFRSWLFMLIFAGVLAALMIIIIISRIINTYNIVLLGILFAVYCVFFFIAAWSKKEVKVIKV
jgi:hypothetical protein